MGRKRRLTKKILADALRETKGGVYLAARRLSCSPSSIYRYLEKYPDLKELKESFAEVLVDKAEYQLHDAVEDGDAWAIKYALSTKGKNRGYTERQEITGADGSDMVIHVKVRDDEA